MDALRYEVWADDNSGARVAAFRYIDDARALAGRISGLVYDTQQEEDVTHYPLGPMRVGGHDERQESSIIDLREQLKVMEQAKRDIGTIITQSPHREVKAALKGIETVIESLTEVSDDLREWNA